MPVPAPAPSTLLRDVPGSAEWGVHPANAPSPRPSSLAQFASTLPSAGSSASAQLLPAQASARAQPHRLPRRQPAPWPGKGRDGPSTGKFGGTSKTPGSHRLCQALPLSLPAIPKDTVFAPKLVLRVPLGTPSSSHSWDLAGFAGRAVSLCLPSAWMGTQGCPRLPEGQEPHPSISTWRVSPQVCSRL